MGNKVYAGHADKTKLKAESKQAKGTFKAQKQSNPQVQPEGVIKQKGGHTKFVW